MIPAWRWMLQGLALLSALPGVAAPTHPARPLLHCTLDGWTRHEGLPLNAIRQVHRARDGYLWLATDVGLVRFDGVRFTLFDSRNVPEFTGDFVNDVEEDRQGTLWIALDGGLVAMRDDRFTAIVLDDLTSRNISDIEEDANGALWLVTAHDLATVRDGRAVPVMIEPPRARGGVKIQAARDGTLWTVGDGLAHIVDGHATIYSGDHELPDVPMSLTEDSGGTLWVGMVNGSLGTMRDGRFEPAHVRGLPSGAIGTLRADGDALWIGVLGTGVHRLRDDRLESLTTREGLKSDDVTDVVPDAEGNVWIATSGGGLHRVREAAVTVISRREGISHPNVLSVFEDSHGALWIGSSGGDLNRIAGGRIDSFGRQDGLEQTAVLSIAEHDGRLWAGTGGGGTFCFDGRRFARCGDGSGTVVTAMLSARDGTLWLGSERGLKRTEGDRVVDVPIRDRDGQQLPVFVIALAEGPDGTIWAGTRSDGLFRVTPGTPCPAVADAGLGKLTILALSAEPDGSLWIGTGNHGLLRWSDGRVVSVRKHQGLPDDSIYSINRDARGHMWLSGSVGIARFDGVALDDLAAGRKATLAAVTYGIAEGLRAGECTGGGQTAWALRDGRLAFATPDGLAMIDPARLPGAGVPPRAVIESLTCDGRRMPLDRRSGTTIPGGSRNCEIGYTSLQLASAAGLEFRYRLVGFDGTWQDAGSRRSAYYTGLGSGEYRFEVAARNREGLGSAAPAVLRIVVARQWHETWWFRAGVMLALAGAGFACFRLRVRALVRRHRELEQVIAERIADVAEANRTLESRVADGIARLREADRMAAYGTLVAGVAHEVRHPMFAIQMATYVLQQELAGNEAVADQLRVLEREARRTMALTDDLVDFARPAGIEKVPTSIEPLLHEAVQSFRAEQPDASVALDVSVTASADQVLLDRARIVQVIVNLMENALKHARGLTRIAIGARIAGDTLVITVENDGSAIAPEALPRIFEPFFTTGRGTGLGLSMVKRIVEQHGGTVAAESSTGHGTRFTLSIPRS